MPNFSFFPFQDVDGNLGCHSIITNESTGIMIERNRRNPSAISDFEAYFVCVKGNVSTATTIFFIQFLDISLQNKNLKINGSLNESYQKIFTVK